MAGATHSELPVETDERGAFFSPRVDFVLLTLLTTTVALAGAVLLVP